jgi:hypothetical protein
VSTDRVIVRRLEAGEAVPPGAIEATLVLKDGEVNPFAPVEKRGIAR